MSELTPCNFCSLQWLKKNARAANSRIVMRKAKGKLGGIDVYIIPSSIAVPLVIVGGTEESEGDAFHQKYFSSWFMKLTDHCVC